MQQFKGYYQSTDVAGEYDNVRFSGKGGQYVDGIEQAAILQGLPEPNAGPLLEIGCGTGRCTESMVRAGYRVLSVDPSEAMLELAQKRLSSLPEDLRQRVELRIGVGFACQLVESTHNEEHDIPMSAVLCRG